MLRSGRIGGTQMGTKTNGYQNVKFSKLKKLAMLIPICFDTPLGAAKETHPNGYQNKWVPKCLVL